MELIDFELIKEVYNPFMGALFFLTGYIATDKLYLHDRIIAFNGNPAWAVLLANLPFVIILLISGECWQVVIITYLTTNGLYSNILKHFKKLLP